MRQGNLQLGQAIWVFFSDIVRFSIVITDSLLPKVIQDRGSTVPFWKVENEGMEGSQDSQAQKAGYTGAFSGIHKELFCGASEGSVKVSCMLGWVGEGLTAQ